MSRTSVPTCRTRPVHWSYLFTASLMLWLVGCGGNPPAPAESEDVIQAFTATPQSVTAGEQVLLSWQVQGARSVSLGGIEAAPGWSMAQVAPLQTTRYELTAVTADGRNVTREVTVEVQPGPTLASVTLDPSANGLRTPEAFLGLSHDWSQAQLMLGDPGVGVNMAYRQLLINLIDRSGGPLTLRIGGRDTDRDVSAPASRIAALNRLHEDLILVSPGVRYILGLNMGSGMPGVAAQQARALQTGLPPEAIKAFELGNQPDFFIPNEKRPRDYTFEEYLSEYRFYADTVRQATPGGPPFAGPAMGGFISEPSRTAAVTGFSTPENLGRMLTQEFNSLALVTHHGPSSGTAACAGNARPGHLLRPASVQEGIDDTLPFLRTAQAAAKPYRVVEMNSLLCNGQPGISDTFESALWVADALFEYAYNGVQGVDLYSGLWNSQHGWDLRSPFLFDVPARQYQVSGLNIEPPAGTRFPAQYELRKVMPLYYGMLMFAEATRNRAELLPVSLATDANVKAWAARDDEGGRLRITLINKDPRASGVVRVSVPGYRTAEVRRLLAPSLGATEGISFGGQTLDGSADGSFLGVNHSERVLPQDGIFEVALSAASAMVVTLTP
ncbi:glycosyl hydrolase family 79 C-terminal domain-containing protein [Pseudomonas sp.]|uniref:glycosyl hydrolase family 79 C-terminal domain-containing protein n=1 Tax=Pseudomonas sp. TaxID=306 RepID=UPI00272B7EF7|nr:glycosyl hydrolase family 79 C-terminal domain-containing protein [Pseudomonas sp.]